MNRVQRSIVNLTEFIESLLVPAFLMLFAIAVSGFHIFKFVQGADGALMGIVMGVGVSLMTIFFANRTLRPSGQERWVAMVFLMFFATLSTIWQYLYQSSHFEAQWIAMTVAVAMPVAEIGLGIVAALQKPQERPGAPESVSAIESISKGQNNAQSAAQSARKKVQAHDKPVERRNPVVARKETPAGDPLRGDSSNVRDDSQSVGHDAGRKEFDSKAERQRFVVKWFEALDYGVDGDWPEIRQQLNLAELTRALEQQVDASNRTLRRDLEHAIEIVSLQYELADGSPAIVEAEIYTNGKEH